MSRIPDRIFWSLVLALQVASIVVELIASDGLAIPVALLSLACCVPLAGLVAQRRFLSHNLWAGFFGIVALYGVLALLAMLAFLALAFIAPAGPTGSLFALGAGVALVQALAVFGAFNYVFGSPQIWGARDERDKTASVRDAA